MAKKFDYRIDRIKKNFNVIDWLDAVGVQYWREGNNVSEGWVNIQCVYCRDHSNHLGINLEEKIFHCWICGRTGDVIDLVRKIERLRFAQAVDRLDEFQEALFIEGRRRDNGESVWDDVLPGNFSPLRRGREPRPVREYFKRRNFGLDICQEFGLGYGVPPGEYEDQLIVPVWLNGEVVSFQTVNLKTGRYLHCPEGRAIVPNNKGAYGLDWTKKHDRVFIVEGVTDVWRLGKGRAVATFTKNYTRPQVLLLDRTLKGKRVRILYDADAQLDGERLSKDLGLFGGVAEAIVVHLEWGDPADLEDKDLRRVLEI